MNDCDGAYWFFTVEKTGNTESTIQNTDFYTLKTGNKVKPTEIGYKYNILLYRKSEVEYTKAILGDPRGYIERMGRIGYGGLIVKDKSVPKNTVKKMLRKVMEDIQTPIAEIRNVLKQV
jgi:hypothetical protein